MYFFSQLYHRLRSVASIPLLIVLLACLSSCKDEGETVNEVRFNLVVEDDLGTKILGTKVYIFDSQAAYENALSSGNYSSAVDSAVTTSTGLTFILEGSKEYWIFTKYFDVVRNYILTNVGNGKIEKLEKNSELDVKLLIAPVSGNVAFWTRSANKLPVTIYVDGVQQPLLTTSMAAAPAGPGDPSAVQVSKLAGNYTYQATAPNGCLWAGQVSISRGSFQAIELTPCLRGRVTFTNSNFDPTHGAIDVFLDNNENIGKISSTGSYTCSSGSAPGTGSGSFVTITRDFNTYTYTAKSQDGKCEWVGTFTINSDNCIVIDLGPCGQTF